MANQGADSGSGQPAADGNAPLPGDDLADLRAAIDEIDERFVELLAERFKVTREVGQLKADLGMPAIDATREDQVNGKARRLADNNGLDANLVSEVLRSIIDRVVAEHRDIADSAAHSHQTNNASDS